MSTIKVNELAESNINLEDLIAKADENGLLTKTTIQKLSTFLQTVSNSGLKPTIINTGAAPTTDGVYPCRNSGVYTNFGGLTVDLNNKLVYISVENNQTDFYLIEIPLNLDLALDTDTLKNSDKLFTGNNIYKKTKSEIIRPNYVNNLNEIERNFFSIFNGVDSVYSFPSTIILENAGDSIEFTFKTSDFSSNKALGSFGEISISNSTIGIGINGNLYVKSAGNSWLTTAGFLTPIVANEEVKISLIFTDTKILIYKNNKYQKQITKSAINIDNIGNSYNFVNADIKDITIVSGGVETYINTPYFLVGAENIELENTTYLSDAENQNLKSANQLIESFNKSTYKDNFYANFNGIDNQLELDKKYTLQNEGDYLEITAKFKGVDFNDGLGLVGYFPTDCLFGFYSSSQIWIKQKNESSYNKILELTGLNEFSTYKFIVINSGTEYQVLRDNISIATFTKNADFDIKQIANAYSNQYAKVDVKDLKIVTSVNSLEIDNLFFGENNQTNFTPIFTPPFFENSVVNYNSCYLSYDPTGFEGRKTFMAYVQDSEKENNFVGFQISHELDTDETIYTNQFRLIEAYIYEFDGVNMVDTGNLFLQSGESEFVYRTADKADFTGGIHGDELLTDINFFVDGVRLTDLELTTGFDLQPCQEFKYIQKSTMHETASDLNVVNSSHPIEAEHIKESIFSNSGYDTKNRIEGKKTGGLDMTICYGSLVAISRYMADHAQSNEYNIVNLPITNANNLTSVNDNMTMWHETNKKSVVINSFFDFKNDNSTQFIWDHPNYAKYYRDLRPVTLALDEIWNFHTFIKFKL